MRLSLTPHPDGPSSPVTRLEVDVVRSGSGLALTYHLSGDVRSVRVPPTLPGGRADGLWRRTCLEAFVRGAGDDYLELNFSPSTQWAAYRFDAYRQGMTALSPATVDVTWSGDADPLMLGAAVDLPPCRSGPLRLALCGVVEDLAGRISYWALAHPSDKPDFHHPDSFVLELP